MKDVIVYTTESCPYCVRAKRLLQTKGVPFREFRLDLEPGLRDEVIRKSGGSRTVPQIFIGGVHVGGCEDLYDLEHEGRLDPLLEGA
jgi:glutaredoxin 3